MVFASPHFTLEELTHSDAALRMGVDNTPSAEVIANLQRLSTTLLEPARAAVGPIETSSGYRCPALNAALKGSLTSAHMRGLAHDGTSMVKSNVDYMNWWVRSSGLPFDQVIYEFGGWVHVGASPEGVTPRRQPLMIFFDSKGISTGYLPWDPARVDPSTGKFKG